MANTTCTLCTLSFTRDENNTTICGPCKAKFTRNRTPLPAGARVQLLVNVLGGHAGAEAMEICSGTVLARRSVGYYDVLVDGDRSAVDVERVNLTPLPATEYLPSEERKAVSRRILAIKRENIHACTECHAVRGWTFCKLHNEA